VKKHRVLIISLPVLALLVCIASVLVLRGYWREQAGRELIHAIKANDITRALAALHAHADPNVRDRGDKTPSLRDYLSKLWKQMRGIEPAPLGTEHTALGLAVQKDNTLLVEALLERGAKNVGDELKVREDSPPVYILPIPLLEMAAHHGNPAMIQTLIEHGWNVNAPSVAGFTALFAARDPATIEILVAYGIDINARELGGCTYLDLCLHDPPDPIALVLLEKGAYDKKALSLAADAGDTRAIDKMLALGWNADTREAGETTPLMTALAPWDRKQLMHAVGSYLRSKGQITLGDRQASVVGLLIRKGANVNFRDSNGQTPLLFASQGGRYPERNGLWRKVLTALLARGAQVNSQDKSGRTPLMVASSNLQPALVRLLLQHGAHVNMRTYQGETALSLARHGDVSERLQREQAEVIRLLKQAGAKE